MSIPTLGPWFYFYKRKYDEHHVSLPLHGQTMRLQLFDNGCTTENAEADARLIAAAPDMLAALLRIAGYPKSRAEELSIEGAREIARAALAIALPANV